MGYDNKVANTLLIIGILEIAAGFFAGMGFGYENGQYHQFHGRNLILTTIAELKA